MTPDRELPVVSVIIPTHNRSGLLRKTLQTVLSQTLRNIEVIIADDASSDNTQEMVRSFHDPRLRYYWHEQNQGAPAARNTGIKAARAPFLAFLDDDVEVLPQKLERQLELLQRPGNEDVAVVLCGVAHRQTGQVQNLIPQLNGWVYEELIDHRCNCSETSAFLVNRSCFDEDPRFDESLPSHQDYDFLVGLSRHGRVLTVPEVLVVKPDFEGEKISTPRRRLQGYLRLHEKYAEVFRARPAAHSQHHLLTARGYWKTGDMAECRQELVKAVQAHPANLNAYGYLAAAQLGASGYRNFQRLTDLLGRLAKPWTIPRSLLTLAGWRRPGYLHQKTV
ncbi:MAG: glycosyltransferase family 2 protein [Dehalococcoidia bacterium]